MALVGVVALLVIGPERLPGVARTAGKWLGNARRFMSSVQADINLEVNKAETLKRLLEEQADIQSMHEILEQTPADVASRKPVPRATPAEKNSEDKPAYLVKAIDDTPVVEDRDLASDASQNSASNSVPSSTQDSTPSSTSSSKHD